MSMGRRNGKGHDDINGTWRPQMFRHGGFRGREIEQE